MYIANIINTQGGYINLCDDNICPMVSGHTIDKNLS